ncbi:MAG: hypothetical protein AAF702_18470 [Chloroflexota bacterium]
MNLLRLHSPKVKCLWIWLGLLLICNPSLSTTFAQSTQADPVQLLQSDVGLALEWRIDVPADGALDSIEELVEAGWTSQLYLDLPLPSYRLTVAELADAELPSSDEIVAFVEATQKEPWEIPIAVQPLPTAIGPTGEELPFISPLDAPTHSIPEQPVFILKEGLQRGRKRFVVAISPIYQVNDQVMIATRGTAWLIGVEQVRESEIDISLPSLAQQDSAGAATSTGRLDSPLPTPMPTAISTVDSQLVPSPSFPESTRPLSPLPTPTIVNTSTMVPALESPLETPTHHVVVATQESPDESQDSAASQSGNDGEGASAEAATPAESPIPTTAQDARTALPLVQIPWSGITFFSMLGVALLLLLLRRNE